MPLHRIFFCLIPILCSALHAAPQRPSFLDNFPSGGPQAPRGFNPARQQFNRPSTPPSTVPSTQIYAPHQQAPYDGPPPKTLVGALTLPEKITEIPTFVGYHKGIRIDIVNGSYQLNEPFAAEPILHIVFTLASVKPVSASIDDANTIAGLAFDAHAAYKSFVVRRNPEYQTRARIGLANGPKKEQAPWLIAQTNLGTKKHLRLIPENALIILIDPAYVTSLEPEKWSAQHTGMARLPRIMLKDNLEQSTVVTMADHSALAALDLDPFHRRPTIVSEVRKELPALVVSMVTELPGRIS